MTEQQEATNLTRGALNGLAWIYSGSAAGAVMQLIYTGVIGRLLRPSDFGLLAMAIAFQRFGVYFARMGLGQALIQKPSLEAADVRTGFTVSLALGLVFGSAVVVGAPLAAAYFDAEAVVPIIRVLALTFLIDSVGQVSTSILKRRLQFRTLAIIDFLTYAVAYLGVGLGMAFAGRGVWSLVGAQLAASALRAILSFAAARHSLLPKFAWSRAVTLFSYGGRLSVISFLEFIGSTLDVLVIGRFSGQRALGQYNRSFLLVSLPFDHIVDGLLKVLFPAFSSIQFETERLAKAYRSGFMVLASALLATATGMAVAAPEIVAVVIGPQWEEAARILPILAFAAAFRFLSHIAGVVCDATARLNGKLVVQAVYVVFLGGVLLIAAPQGDLAYYAFALLAATLVRHFMYMWLMDRVIGYGLRAHLRLYSKVMAGSLVVLLLVGGVTLVLRPVAPAFVVLIAQATAGGVSVLLSLLWGPYASVRREVHERLMDARALDGTHLLARMGRGFFRIGR